MKPVASFAETASATSLECPKCHSPMELVTYEGITIDRCTRCCGMWFDANEQKALKEQKGSEAVDVGDPQMGRKMDKITDINCPRCGVAMIRMVHVDQQSTDYEACPNCYGIFLDAGEFRILKDCSMSEYLAGLLEPYKKR
jgi:Zn-finger nucleic acid-binding protein